MEKNLQSSIAKQRKGLDLNIDLSKSTDNKSINLPDHLLKPIKPLKQVKDYTAGETEKIYLKELMLTSKGDLDTASALSCISKSRIYSLLKQHNIPRSS